MASSIRYGRSLLVSATRSSPLRLANKLSAVQRRYLHGSLARQTDGVFRELSDERLPMPWIEAFRMQQKAGSTQAEDSLPSQRDLSPRKMKDSYHRVVLPLARDPWLSDTYLNSSGHIRY
jgi:acyl-coenzyme A thioesterase 9